MLWLDLLGLMDLIGSGIIFLYGLVVSLDFLTTDLIFSDLLFSRMVFRRDLDIGDDDLSFLQTGDRLISTLFLMILGKLFLMVYRLKLVLVGPGAFPKVLETLFSLSEKRLSMPFIT